MNQQVGIITIPSVNTQIIDISGDNKIIDVSTNSNNGIIDISTTKSSNGIIDISTTPTTNQLFTINNPTQTIRIGALTAADFQHLSQREHIYKIPDTYVGSADPVERAEWVYVKGFNLPQLANHPEITTPMAYVAINFPEACEQVFREIISNSADNITRSHLANVDPGIIDVKMTNKTVTVRNGGLPIPVEWHPQQQMYVPQMIFGVLLTSSHYDTRFIRVENGRNGYGAKLTNIFSKRFEVNIGDAGHHLRYHQEWKDNMLVRSEPIIAPYEEKESFVEISYDLDFARFGYKEYPPEAFGLYARHIADLSVTSKVICHFNGQVFDFRNIHQYKNLYRDPKVGCIVHRQWGPGVETKEVKGEIVAVDPRNLPDIELCIMDTPDNSIIISFVNGTMTANSV